MHVTYGIALCIVVAVVLICDKYVRTQQPKDRLECEKDRCRCAREHGCTCYEGDD